MKQMFYSLWGMFMNMKLQRFSSDMWLHLLLISCIKIQLKDVLSGLYFVWDGNIFILSFIAEISSHRKKEQALNSKLWAEFFFSDLILCPIRHLHFCWRAVKKVIADFWSRLSPYCLQGICMMFHGLMWGCPMFISKMVIILALSTNW